MSIAGATRNMLARMGRPMTLRRRQGTANTFTEAAAQGVLRAFQPDQLAGGVMQGDARVILDAVPVAAADLAPVRKGDLIVADGRTWSVQGAEARYVGAALAAYEVWVRGG